MKKIETLNEDNNILYSTKYFSGNYNHEIYLRRAISNYNELPKFYFNIYTKINDELIPQGYLYFYLDFKHKISYFIGTKVANDFRNLNIASLLISLWIDLCLNNGYDILGTSLTQRKPFLLYLLKTYGFEIFNTDLYTHSSDTITICRSINSDDLKKYLLFKSQKHELAFCKTNIFKSDDYEIVQCKNDLILLDDIILPLQNRKRAKTTYELLDPSLAEPKVIRVLSSHSK